MPVETKLHAPGIRPEWVQRRELAGYLTAATARLILVSAPVGFGKTTLMAQWRAGAMPGRRFAWISLDRGDNDPGRLWSYIIYALQRACPEFDGDGLLRAVSAQVPDIEGAVLPLLVNELAALTAPVVLVLDDYHLISDASCHDQVTFLLLHLPPSAQVVLVTRTVPPLPVARLRAGGELAEIGARELRFAVAEAALLVGAASGTELSKADLAVLMEQTEGWPAGLYLSALSLRGHPSPGVFIRQFSGDNEFIADLLAEEVISRQPDEIQEFLARTAILDRFCAPLCDAVTGSANAAQIIDVLEREIRFIVPLDDLRRWFRYHHLFAQVLRRQLASTEPDLVPTLHRRASAWHRRSGSTDEAISHALAAGDVAETVDLIAHHWYSYVDSGRVATVRGWLRSLGDDQIAVSPVAAHCAAWAAALTGEQESVQRWLPVIEAGQHDGGLPDGIRSLKSSVALLGGAFGFSGIRAMRESAATAVTLETDQASPWHALALASLGFSLHLSGAPGAAEPLRRAVRAEASIPLVRMIAFSVAALVAADEGKVAQAKELAGAARRLADDRRHSQAPQSSFAHTAAGAAWAVEGRLQEACAELERALRSRRRLPGLSPWLTVDTLLRLAPLRLDLGDRPGAATLLSEARELLAAFPDGAEAQLARLESIQRRIETGPPQATPPAGQLTERELAVLRLLSGTLSVRGLAQQLSVSQNTVKTQVQSIYRKLGVSSRGQAIQKARHSGLL